MLIFSMLALERRVVSDRQIKTDEIQEQAAHDALEWRATDNYHHRLWCV